MLERCWFERNSLKELLDEAGRWPFRETGGALLGWRDERQAVIRRVLGPGPKAKHALSHFEPDGAWQVAHGREIYRASGRTIAYLGDWHSHPRGQPSPSRQDLRTARLIAEDPDFRAPSLLYAIVGRSLGSAFRGGGWRLLVYAWNDETLVPVEVRVYEATLLCSSSP